VREPRPGKLLVEAVVRIVAVAVVVGVVVEVQGPD
jgi:hypothetical protein